MLVFYSIVFKNKRQMYLGLGVMLFPPAAVKQKAKEGLERLGGALFYPSVKRSPCAFGFCVWWD
jgi:hypothetical protein